MSAKKSYRLSLEPKMDFIVKDKLLNPNKDIIDLCLGCQIGRKLIREMEKVKDRDTLKVKVDLTGTTWEEEALTPFLKMIGKLDAIDTIVANKEMLERAYLWLALVSYSDNKTPASCEEEEVDSDLEDEFAKTQQMM